MMDKLSVILWRERELLETLHYKLEVEQMVLASGRSRWLMQAARDVDAVLETIRETEVLRSVAADEVAARLGLKHNPSLSALADSVDEPWGTILREHRDAFIAVTREIADLADTNRDLISAGYRSARDTLLSLGEETSGYTPDGSALTGPSPHRLLDRSL